MVGDPRWVGVLAWLALPALGAGLGWLVLPALDRLAELDWLPLPGVVEAVTRVPAGWSRVVATVLGAVGGALMAVEVARDTLRVEVSDERAALRRRDATSEVARSTADAVFVDGGRLVVLDRAGRELARLRSDQRRARLAEAFTRHGWPWRDDDPYARAYRRWVPGLPDLPAGADALLAARERALRRDDRADAEALRAELARLGVVVRDEKRHQLWRLSSAA